MTPLDTNSILRILAGYEISPMHESSIQRMLVLAQAAYDADVPDGDFRGAEEALQGFMDIASYIALGVEALKSRREIWAMKRAVSDEHDAINDMRKQDGNSDWKEGYESGLRGVTRRTSELLAALEKGE